MRARGMTHLCLRQLALRVQLRQELERARVRHVGVIDASLLSHAGGGIQCDLRDKLAALWPCENAFLVG